MALALLAGAGPARPTVLVCAPRQLDSSQELSWLGRGLQESLEVALSSGAAVRAEEPGTPGADPMIAAHDVGAQFVLSGSYQFVHDRIRVGLVLSDVQSGQALAAWNTDAAPDDLLRLEDDCGDRAVRAVRSALWWQEPAHANELSAPLTRDQAAAAFPTFGSPRVAPAPKPVAGQRDDQPYGDRDSLAHYHYFYQYPIYFYGYGYYGCYGWCGYYAIPYGFHAPHFLGLLGGPQATVGFATGGY